MSKELLPENFLSEEHDTEWAEDIGTTLVNRNAYNLKKTKAQIKEIVDRAAKMNNPSTYKSLSDRIDENEKVSVSDNGKATVNGEEITLDMWRMRPWYRKALSWILKFCSPLF